MFRTIVKAVSTALMAAAVAAPVAFGGNSATSSPRPADGLEAGYRQYIQRFSATGVTAQKATEDQRVASSLESGYRQYVQRFSPALGRTADPIGTHAFAPGGFDWSAAAIGAGVIAGLCLLVIGVGAMTLRARRAHGRLGATYRATPAEGARQ